ncbi:MAG: ABC transporter permease [Kiritimatiellaeota bacterium]|nr:ABC transporter permease [Kiritimatiellota bacterium]
MNVYMIFKVAMRALFRNKVRSFLTALGIIVGIAAVIAVVAIGEGASISMKAQISSMGDNIIIVFPGSANTGGVRLGAGGQQTLMLEDGEAMRRDYPELIKTFTPLLRSGGQAIFQQNNWSTQVQGVTTEFFPLRKWDIAAGAAFTDADLRSATRVCVVGQTVVDNLFDGQDPVGETFRIRNIPFRVLGVLSRKGTNSMGMDQDDIIIAPFTTVKRNLKSGAFNNVDQLLFSLYSLDQIPEAKRQLTALLRQRHRLAPGTPDDFTAVDMVEIADMATSISKMMTILMAVVASISLLVGGIGIMNIMLVSVTERTREIGLRMAIGASPAAILMQFLTEAAVLSTMGGLIGIGLGMAGARTVGNINHWPIFITPASVVISFGFSAFVGVFFGFYPALRASRLNPIDCLRYE